MTGLEEDDDWVEDGSVCSIHSSMCTTASFSEGGSIVGDMEVVDEDGVEMVFMLTGELGVCISDKADVGLKGMADVGLKGMADVGLIKAWLMWD